MQTTEKKKKHTYMLVYVENYVIKKANGWIRLTYPSVANAYEFKNPRN